MATTHVYICHSHFPDMFSNLYTGQVLQRYPSTWIADAPENREILDEFIHALSVAFEMPSEFDEAQFKKFPVALITDYIRKTHRHYLFRKLPEMEQSIQLLLQDYSDDHPLLHILQAFYSDYKTELSLHICEEENHLLPYVDYLLHAENEGCDLREFFRQTKRYCMNDFEQDHHDDHEKELLEIKRTIQLHRPPPTNGTPYRILVQQLDNFHRDLVVHGLIEDRVLLPKMKEMESRLTAAFNTVARLN
jgi:regulator of cell morphogenesis and NO signaling